MRVCGTPQIRFERALQEGCRFSGMRAGTAAYDASGGRRQLTCLLFFWALPDLAGAFRGGFVRHCRRGGDIMRSKKISLFGAVAAVLLAVLLTFNMTYLTLNNKYSRKLNEILAGYGTYDKLEDIASLIRENYIGEVDEDALNDAIMSGYLSGIGDKYARYISALEFKEWQLNENGRSVGIGVQVIYNEALSALEIVRILPDSPAEKAGLSVSDLITAMDGQTVADVGYDGAKKLMKGDAGSEVSLSVIRDMSQQLDFKLKRAEVASVSVTSHLFRDADGNTTDVGVIRIYEFNQTTPEQFRAAVEELRTAGASRFVYDLRNNPGGALSSVVSVLDYLLPEGPIVHLTDKAGERKTESSDAEFLDVPCCVLVNGSTASAAELFAAALKDYAARGEVRAIVLGTKTYGKGPAQSVMRLSDNSAISISTKMYDPPYSGNYEGVGVKPDREVALSEEAQKINFYKLTDETDNQLQEAVSALS